MTITYLFILAVVQGITEFFPISSSGHLVLLPHVMGVPDQGLVIDVAVHVGTLLAIVVYYRKDIRDMIFSIFNWQDPARKKHRTLALCIAVGTIPAIIFGIILQYFYPNGIRSLAVIAATTLFFGTLMGIADHFSPRKKTIQDINLKSALIIGFAQMLALIPGTSRSGSTMTAARFLGFDRVDAARFSFLLGIPATFGAGLVGLYRLIESGDTDMGMQALIAAIFAFFAALAAISLLMRWLRSYGLLPFVIYRLILGFVLVAFIFSGEFA